MDNNSDLHIAFDVRYDHSKEPKVSEYDSATIASHCTDESEIKKMISCGRWWIRAAAAHNPRATPEMLLLAMDDGHMSVRIAAADSLYRILKPMGLVSGMDSSLWIECAANDPIFGMTLRANMIHHKIVSKKQVLAAMKEKHEVT